MGTLKYFKSAFVNRWNLLLVAGGMAFAAMSGHFEAVGALVMAAEITYLGLLGTNPKFISYVNAQEAAERRQDSSQSSQQVLRQIMQTLPQASWGRFEKLRARCLELRQIASDLRTTSAESDQPPLESSQIAGLDRLLWIYLRLLFTQVSLSKFLERTSPDRIEQDVLDVEKKLKQLPPDNSTPHTEKIRRTLEDNLATCRDRLANYQKAQANHELVGLEIDRLENKIKSVAEMAINRQEPDYISSQVDLVASSMVETEKTMNELKFATGIDTIDEEVPELVKQPPVQYARGR